MSNNIVNMDEHRDSQDEALVILVDEDGKEHEFLIVDILAVAGKEYALLVPAEDDQDDQDEEEEVLVLRFDNDDKLVTIEDEAEFDLVVKHLEMLGTEGV